jgi:hypothetical protein
MSHHYWRRWRRDVVALSSEPLERRRAPSTPAVYRRVYLTSLCNSSARIIKCAAACSNALPQRVSSFSSQLVPPSPLRSSINRRLPVWTTFGQALPIFSRTWHYCVLSNCLLFFLGVS